MNELKTFEHSMFGELSVIVVSGIEWFGATEAAKALNFSNPHVAIKNHIEEDDLTDHEVIDNLGRKQSKKFTNESGLYSLIFGAAKQGNNPEIKAKAKQFKKWVTSDVLPSIRKHGAYMTDDTLKKALTSPDFLIQLATSLKEEKTARLAAEKTIEEQRHKVVFAEAIEVSKNSILVKDLAALLKQKGINIGQNRLFEWLRENDYICKKKGEMYNKPTQRSLDLKILEVKTNLRTASDGELKTSHTPKVTGKGQIYFINKFLKLANQEVIQNV